MTARLPVCVSIALALSCPVASLAQLKNPDGVPVLLLSGGQRQHHGYREQALYLSRTLENTGRYRVTVVEDAAVLESPSLDKYRAVVVLADRRDPEFRFTEPSRNG